MIDKLIVFFICVQVLLRASFVNVDILPTLDMAGSSSFGIHDLAFFLLLGLVVVKISTSENLFLKWNTNNKLLAIFILFGMLSVINAVLTGTGFHLAAREARDFMLYSIYFFVLAIKFDVLAVRSLVKYLMWIGLITSFFSVLQVIMGDRISFLYGKVATLNTLDSSVEGVTRISIGGLSTINFMFFISFAYLLERVNKKHLIYFFILSIGIIVSFNRGTWLSIILALLAILPFIDVRSKTQIIRALVIIGALGISFVGAGSTGVLGEKINRYADAAIDRFTSLMPDQLEEDGSTQDRFSESKQVFEKYMDRPIIGHGLGAITFDNVKTRGEADYAESKGSWGYVHNGYLYVLFKLGAIGFLILFFFYLKSVLLSIKNIKNIIDYDLRAIYIGSLLFVISIVPHSLVSPRIMEGKYIVNIVIAFALLEIIRRFSSNERLTDKQVVTRKVNSVEMHPVAKQEKYESVRLR